MRPKGLPARDRRLLDPTQSLLARLPMGPGLKVLLVRHHLDLDQCVAACLHLQRRITLLPAPTILSRRSSHHRLLTLNHNCPCTSNNSSSRSNSRSNSRSHRSRLASRTPTTVLTLAVFRRHRHLHLLASVVRQVRPRARALCLHTVPVPVALHQRCALLSRTDRRLHGMGTRVLINTMLTLLLAAAALLVELLRQPRLKQLPIRQPAIVTSVLRPHHQRGIVNGKTMITLTLNLLRMTRSARRSRSLTVVAPPHPTACPRPRCRARVRKTGPTPAASTMVIIHRRLLTTRHRYLPWQLRVHCLACPKRQSKSDLSIMSQQLAIWM